MLFGERPPLLFPGPPPKKHVFLLVPKTTNHLLDRHHADGEPLQLPSRQHSHVTVQHVSQVHLKVAPRRTNNG